MPMRGLTLILLLAACGDDPTMQLRFAADPGAPGSEKYLCFGFDAGVLGGADIGGLVLDAPAGPVTLHHVSLYASTTDIGAGPVECEQMPADAVSLHVWALGTGDLALRAGPRNSGAGWHDAADRAGARAARRGRAGGAAAIAIETRRDAEHRAAWLSLRVPTPAINPHRARRRAPVCDRQRAARDLDVAAHAPPRDRVSWVVRRRGAVQL